MDTESENFEIDEAFSDAIDAAAATQIGSLLGHDVMTVIREHPRYPQFLKHAAEFTLTAWEKDLP